MTKLFLARVEILLQVASEGEACDALSETLRPLLIEFGGEVFVDWRYADQASPEEVKRTPAWVEYKVKRR